MNSLSLYTFIIKDIVTRIKLCINLNCTDNHISKKFEKIEDISQKVLQIYMELKMKYKNISINREEVHNIILNMIELDERDGSILYTFNYDDNIEGLRNNFELNDTIRLFSNYMNHGFVELDYQHNLPDSSYNLNCWFNLFIEDFKMIYNDVKLSYSKYKDEFEDLTIDQFFMFETFETSTKIRIPLLNFSKNKVRVDDIITPRRYRR